MDNQLLTMKLYAPPLRPGLVHRLRLLQKMGSGLLDGKQLTLITAPAGYGKTTLALEWLASLDQAYSWLSLDRADNHPLQFLTYLIAALGKVDEKVEQALEPFLQARHGQDEAARVHSLLTALVNQLAKIQTPFILVLDDYHTITDLAVHEALGFILEHQPPQMHLVIATRQDPLLPLSKLRTRGQLTEIRLGELRFTQEETNQFLNETMKLGLLPDEIVALEVRTEGWIAGLQLAALSLSELPAGSQTPLDAEARSKYILAFAGDDRHVVDYLLDEVLSRQPEEVQRFLLNTSVLNRLSGPLCDALLEDHGQSSQQLLESLERSNLFIIPLDNRRQWYRYHHLFADLLSSRLQSTNPDQVTVLHHRARKWFESANMFADAVDHALLAEDFDSALRLIEEIAGASIWVSGELPVLLNWSKRLPEEVLMSRPRLSLYCARALFFNGQIDMADRYLQHAETALSARGQNDGSMDEVWGVLYTNQATVRAMCGDSEVALELANRAKTMIPKTDVSTQARIAHALGMAAYLQGDLREAELAFSEAVQLAQQVNNRNLRLDVIACLAITQILSGRLREAERLCQNILDTEFQNQSIPTTCAIFFALALIKYEQNELLQAQHMVETSIQLAQEASWLHILWQAYLLQSQIQQAMGESQKARQAIWQAEQVAVRYKIPRVSRIISAHQANIDLAGGNLEAAVRWVEVYESRPAAENLRDFEELTRSRILLTQGNYSESLSVVNCTLEKAGAARRIASVIEAKILRVEILEARGECEAGIKSMIEAIELAEPEGFVRVFLNSGKSTADLLSRVRRLKIPTNVMRYSWRLLQAFNETGLIHSLSQTVNVLVEPLSERELEVLHLIAGGLSNPEIAARLYLSVNTLRAHTTHIYQKLEVHSRMQAVARAKELGLLHPE
ncbi:MAG TPA: LuxR C-terminal-related transcriptional regulator [Anaerolineales bacterium]|nr:LuxR C-terminal-related transcriptional regulator [Anaerolineales bacterium]